MFREFAVAKINPERGLINGILALDCTCDTVDRLSRIRSEIARILPDMQIIKYASQALTRAEARQRAATEAQTSIQREKDGRAKIRGEREALVAVLVPVILVGSSIWIGLLALANVRERRGEIGILRALGLQARQFLLIFLGKAIVIGLGGAALGYVLGRAIGALWRDAPGAPPIPIAFVDPRVLLLVLITAPVLAALASWLPAISAAQQDPAVVLREE